MNRVPDFTQEILGEWPAPGFVLADRIMVEPVRGVVADAVLQQNHHRNLEGMIYAEASMKLAREVDRKLR